MSRTTIQPLGDLGSVMPVDRKHPTEGELRQLKLGFRELLLGHNCVTNGAHLNRIHDPDWSHDINFIVNQVKPTLKVYERESGLFVVVERILQIETLRCEVDYRHEICCWMYTHSNEDT